MIGEWKTSIVD